MSRRRVRRLFLTARIFLICATLVLLTITVLQRPDHDGYQSTHLFFMPRETWEMDFGRGMLHTKEHYRQMDVYQTVAELHGPQKANGVHLQGPTVTRTPTESAHGVNGIFLAFVAIAFLSPSKQTSIFEEVAIRPDTWKDDVPSPPPRSRHFL